MILEHALIAVRPGSGPEFEATMEEARTIIAASPGFRSLELRRGIEVPDRYLLLVEWDDLDSHLVGFRGSEAFVRWREAIGPYFDGQPQVDHYELVEGLG